MPHIANSPTEGHPHPVAHAREDPVSKGFNVIPKPFPDSRFSLRNDTWSRADERNRTANLLIIAEFCR